MDPSSPKSRPDLKPGPDYRPESSCESEDRESSRDCAPVSKRRRQDRPGPSCESVKSDQSKDADLFFQTDTERPGPSCESVQSDRSKGREENFRSDPPEDQRLDPAGEQFLVPGLRKYSCEVRLDPNTAHSDLSLSEDNLSVSCQLEDEPYPDHQDRFMEQPQVLSSSGLRGRCYWEVKWRGDIDIAMSYRRNRPRGDSEERRFGEDDQSWSLRVESGYCSVFHNNTETILPHIIEAERERRESFEGIIKTMFILSRVGVFLDSEAGSLSFYKIIDDKAVHLHTFSSSFTEPLFPGLGLWNMSQLSVVKLCS